LVCTPESFTKRIAASQRQQLTDTTPSPDISSKFCRIKAFVEL
jgi:hypothetical protein